MIVWYLLRKKDLKVHLTRVVQDMRAYITLFIFIGITYTINLTATYQAKLLSPTAGYVTSIKAAQVVPMVLLGAWFFREKVTHMQSGRCGAHQPGAAWPIIWINPPIRAECCANYH